LPTKTIVGETIVGEEKAEYQTLAKRKQAPHWSRSLRIRWFEHHQPPRLLLLLLLLLSLLLLLLLLLSGVH